MSIHVHVYSTIGDIVTMKITRIKLININLSRAKRTNQILHSVPRNYELNYLDRRHKRQPQATILISFRRNNNKLSLS